MNGTQYKKRVFPRTFIKTLLQLANIYSLGEWDITSKNQPTSQFVSHLKESVTLFFPYLFSLLMFHLAHAPDFMLYISNNRFPYSPSFFLPIIAHFLQVLNQLQNLRSIFIIRSFKHSSSEQAEQGKVVTTDFSPSK